MDDPHLQAPLAQFGGAAPPAPAWFADAMAKRPEINMVEVEGAKIEMLTWGERGRPGLLLLHGNGAHAGWWRFIAPFLAEEYRFCAISWGGMGGSDWRETYTIETFIAEALASAETAGLFDSATKPIFVGHSFGGHIAIFISARYGERLGATILVDPPIFTPERIAERRARPRKERVYRAHRVYATREQALARFRFAPTQACDNLFIADAIARESLKEVAGGADAGWTWRFDPFLWKNLQLSQSTPLLKEARSPMALIRGDRSRLIRVADANYAISLMPPGSPHIPIPDADHHVMIDQPLAVIAALRGLLAAWP
ncbi:MAG: alpha/beta hydrolase [Methylobacteriaceae bacterium]|nr:alpha/beta hydrolase [Methylobacteriaceae bacterium]